MAPHPQAQTKKSYSDMLGVLGPLATFAGGLTIATQFIIQCPNARLQVLLAIISELFLASLLGTVVMYLILYGLDDKTRVTGFRRHYLIFQFCLVGIMMAAAFMLLAVALMVAVEGTHLVGIEGVVLIGILVVGAICLGCMILHERKKEGIRKTEKHRNCKLLLRCCCGTEEGQDAEIVGERTDKETADLRCCQAILLWCICVLELVAIPILLGSGGSRAGKAPRRYGCSNGTTVLFPSPLPTIPVSVMEENTAPAPQITGIIETISETVDVSIIIINISGWESGPYQKTTRTTTLTTTVKSPPRYSSSGPMSTFPSSTLSPSILSSPTLASSTPSSPTLSLTTLSWPTIHSPSRFSRTTCSSSLSSYATLT